MGTVSYPDFGGSARRAPPPVQVSPVREEGGDKTVLEVGGRIQLPDGSLGNVEVLVESDGVLVTFSNRHTEPRKYDFDTLSRHIRRRPKGAASSDGVALFNATTPLEIVYGGAVICSFIAVDTEKKQVTVQR